MANRTRLVWVVALAFFGCASPPEPTPLTARVEAPPTTPTTPPIARVTSPTTGVTPEGGAAAPKTLPQHMAAHFAQAIDLREAVILGDLGAAVTAARMLADYNMKDLPDGWAPYVDRLRAAAKSGADAKTLDEAARAVGDVASACGGCHQARGGPIFDPGDPPAAVPGTATHMARHHWAAARMWEGLVGPNNTAWTKGTEVLADAPLATTPANPTIDALAKRVHALGERGRNLIEQSAESSPIAQQRGAVYGELVATCANCHQATGKVPTALPAK